MTTAATVFVKLVMDAGHLMEEVDKAKKKLDSFANAASGIGDKLSSIGNKMTLGVTAPVVAGFGYITKAASDANESVNAVNVVFGNAADSVLAFSEKSAEMVGMSSADFNQLAAVSGAFLKNTGMSADEAGNEVVKLATRASDMASIFNTDVSEAMTAIQAALRGEADPIERFGVKMNEAGIKAKAAAMGLATYTVDALKVEEANVKMEKAQKDYNTALAWYGKDSLQAQEAKVRLEKATNALADAQKGEVSELTNSQKTQAALALFYEQTEQFAGDFINTSDALANGTKVTTAMFNDMAASLGKNLLPYALKIMQFANDLITRFSGLDENGQKVVLMILAIGAAVGPALSFLGTLFSVIGSISAFFAAPAVTGAIAAIGAALSAAALPIAAIVAAVGLLYLAWTNNFGGIQEKMAAFWAWLQPLLAQLWDWLGTKLTEAGAALSAFWSGTLLPALQAVWQWMSTVLFPFFQSLVDFFNAVFTLALTAMAGLWQNVILPALQEVAAWLTEHLSPAFAAISEWWNTNGKPVAEAIGEWFGEKIPEAFDAITKAIQGATKWLGDMANKISTLELPDWLTPGSPTPFEIGLLGINRAMQKLNNQGLPEMNIGFGNIPTQNIESVASSAPAQPQPAQPQGGAIDYRALADALVGAMQRAGVGAF